MFYEPNLKLFKTKSKGSFSGNTAKKIPNVPTEQFRHIMSPFGFKKKTIVSPQMSMAGWSVLREHGPINNGPSRECLNLVNGRTPQPRKWSTAVAGELQEESEQKQYEQIFF